MNAPLKLLLLATLGLSLVTAQADESIADLIDMAKKGDADAQFQLGDRYLFGEGIPKDNVEAVKWFRLAAEKGLPQAQFNLGLSYSKGEGVLKDAVESYKWFNLAAAQGHQRSGNYRDDGAKSMTPDQIAEAQKLSREWKPTVRE